MKTCFKCNESKPRSEFYAHAQMADGLLGKCKACCKKDVHENREKNQDYYNQKDRERARRGQPRRMAYQKETKGIRVAHRLLYKALKDGLLTRQPCRECGDVRAHGHHEDYSKPLEVVWLCQKHHRRRHAELDAMGIDVHATIPVAA